MCNIDGVYAGELPGCCVRKNAPEGIFAQEAIQPHIPFSIQSQRLSLGAMNRVTYVVEYREMLSLTNFWKGVLNIQHAVGDLQNVESKMINIYLEGAYYIPNFPTFPYNITASSSLDHFVRESLSGLVNLRLRPVKYIP